MHKKISFLSRFFEELKYSYLFIPIQEDRLLERSIMARLLGLLSSDRFAREISAVTRVIVILKQTVTFYLQILVHMLSCAKVLLNYFFNFVQIKIFTLY